MFNLTLFTFGFFFLIKGADLLVDGSTSLARKLKVSDLVIGLTVVAFGTSTSELLVNIFASFTGHQEIAVGNIIGSNIVNILLILGVSSVIFPLKVTTHTVAKEIPLSLLAAVMVYVLANDQLIFHSKLSQISRIDGMVLFAFFCIFLFNIFGTAKHAREVLIDNHKKQHTMLKSIMFVSLGMVGLLVGGYMVVDGAVKLTNYFGVSESFVGLTIVAIGTSLPELATSTVAAFRKNADIAVGNIVGSNIFNIFFILGISAMIKPLPFSTNHNIDVFITILASIVLLLAMFVGKKKMLGRWEGIFFIFCYVGYIYFLIKRG